MPSGGHPRYGAGTSRASNDASGLALADLLLGRKVGTSTGWTEYERSAALETANIVGCAYLNALFRSFVASEADEEDHVVGEVERRLVIQRFVEARGHGEQRDEWSEHDQHEPCRRPAAADAVPDIANAEQCLRSGSACEEHDRVGEVMPADAVLGRLDRRWKQRDERDGSHQPEREELARGTDRRLERPRGWRRTP